MRLSRRELLGGAALAAGASLAPHLAWAGTKPLPGIVADPTIAAGKAAATHARTLGLPVAEQGHDLAALFYGSGPAWLSDGRAVAGVTGWAGMVLAQGIARERGLAFSASLPQELGDLAGIIAGQPGFCWTIG